MLQVMLGVLLVMIKFTNTPDQAGQIFQVLLSISV
jgi:hypothetical protein